jgi:DNA-binding MarR family transcriptional regulator
MVKRRLKDELRKKRDWSSPEQEAYINILRTHSLLFVRFDRLFRQHGISSPQYNILRILRGHGGDGIPSLEIASQMIASVPDITRLLDKLEKAGYVTRERSTEDRRVVRVMITAGGRKLLAKLDEPVRDAERASLGHLTRKDLADVSKLMTKARQSVLQNGSE